MPLYVATGLYGVWYALLWIAVAPFALMLLWTFVRLRPANSAQESTWLNGSVLGAFVLLLLTTLGSAIMYSRAQPGHGFWTYTRWIATHFLTWTFLGSGIFFASLQALAAGSQLLSRRIAAMLAVAGVGVMHAASLFAAFRYLTR